MLTIHHLNESRSQRVIWLAEELGLPYEVALAYVVVATDRIDWTAAGLVAGGARVGPHLVRHAHSSAPFRHS